MSPRPSRRHVRGAAAGEPAFVRGRRSSRSGGACGSGSSSPRAETSFRARVRRRRDRAGPGHGGAADNEQSGIGHRGGQSICDTVGPAGSNPAARRLPAAPACGRAARRPRQCGGSAAIVGPHGSGKTTLALASGRRPRGTRVSRRAGADVAGGRCALSLIRALIHAAARERRVHRQLGAARSAGGSCARGFAALRGLRLLVTAHRSGPLPTLWICRTSTALSAAIVERLPQAGGFRQPSVRSRWQTSFTGLEATSARRCSCCMTAAKTGPGLFVRQGRRGRERAVVADGGGRADRDGMAR